MDDLTVRTGKVLDGRFYTDEELTVRLKEAVAAVTKQQVKWVGQSPEEALGELGFITDQLGAESYLKPTQKVKRK